MKPLKLLERILGGSLNVSFADMRRLVEAFGFRLSAGQRQPSYLYTPRSAGIGQPAKSAGKSETVPNSAVPQARGRV